MDELTLAPHKKRSPPKPEEEYGVANPGYVNETRPVRYPRVQLKVHSDAHPLERDMTVARREDARRGLDAERQQRSKEERAMNSSSNNVLNAADSNHDGELSRREVETALNAQDDDMKLLRQMVIDLRSQLRDKVLEDLGQHASKILEQAELASRRGYLEQGKLPCTVSDMEFERTMRTQEGVKNLLRDSHSNYEALKDAKYVAIYQVQLNEAQRTIAELRNHLKKALADINDKVVLEERVETKKNDDLKAAETKVMQLDSELDGLKTQFKEATEKNKELTERVASTRGDKLSLTAVREMGDKGCSIYHGGATSSWAAAEKQVKDLCQGYNELEAQAQAATEEALAKFASYETSIEKLEATIEDKKDAIEECEEEIGNLKEQHAAALAEQASDTDAIKEEYDDKIQQLEITIEDHIAQIGEKTEEAEKLQTELTNNPLLFAKDKEFTDFKANEYAALEAKIAALEEGQQEGASRLQDEHEAEVAKIREEAALLEKKLEDAETAKEQALAEQHETLKKKFHEEKEAAVANMKKRITQEHATAMKHLHGKQNHGKR